VQTVKLRLDLLVRKAKRQDNFFHTGASQQLQVPLEQASASESQQALGRSVSCGCCIRNPRPAASRMARMKPRGSEKV